jgi:division/cell wall cluster transcriptional repressor MraZ
LQTTVNKTMPDKQTTEQIYYNGLFRHGVDEKRRVQVPAKWRPYESGIELTLILWPKSKEGPCLRVLPPKEMAEMMAAIDAMPNSDPNKTVLKRFIGSESVQVTLDKAGRICLPEEMAKSAGIEGGFAGPIRDLGSGAICKGEGVGCSDGARSIQTDGVICL